MEFIAIAVAVGVLLIVLSPFWVGAGGSLQAASTESSPERLQQVKSALLRRYLVEEKAAAAGQLTTREWQARQQFLTNRYLDAARRLDYVRALNSTGESQA